MRIDRLQLTNFKCFADESFAFDPEFTLFVGENGAGKTSILSAVAIALGIYDQNETIKQTIRNTDRAWRKIYDDEVRLVSAEAGDRGLFQPAGVCEVKAEWKNASGKPPLKWSRRLEDGRRKNDAKDVVRVIDGIIAGAAARHSPAPLLAYYGAGRAWLASNERVQRAGSGIKKPSQWDGYYDCLQERIRLKDLDHWFRDEAAARDDKGGWRPGYKTVLRAILNCIPDAREVQWDSQRLEICLNIAGNTVPFSLLSDGQKTMTAMVADLAIRAVTLNSFLFGDAKEVPEPPDLPVVLQMTPGIVLIDEIDVHLHPIWQRQVVGDLQKTFPRVQFICTSHSPQVMGETKAASLRIFNSTSKKWVIPNQSFGMDSNWILKVLMGGHEMDPGIEREVKAVQEHALKREFDKAESGLASLRAKVGNSEEIQYAASTIERIKLLGK